jgi:hypothetical protein
MDPTAPGAPQQSALRDSPKLNQKSRNGKQRKMEGAFCVVMAVPPTLKSALLTRITKMRRFSSALMNDPQVRFH